MAAAWAALTHDAGKLAAGFQQQLGNGGDRKSWGQRHEVLSLGFLSSLLNGLPKDLHGLVAIGVATHHRALHGELGNADSRKPALSVLYGGVSEREFADGFGPTDVDSATELARWLALMAHNAGLPGAPPGELPPTGLIEAAYDELNALFEGWEEVEPSRGLAAVLVQGAVTMADHLASAHRGLNSSQPLGPGIRQVIEAKLAEKQATLAGFQLAAAGHDGHLLLRAPTGGGKTEAALLWAAGQVRAIVERAGGVPRVFYTLPYLASINAMAVRFGTLLGDDVIGVSHSRAGSFHLNRAVADPGDEPDSRESPVTAAEKAVSRQQATRLFRETLRVGTPYQLLRGALAGAAHSSVLLDAANSVFVLDELHAYDPKRLGMILAGLRFWERLGGRIAVVSATLPTALAELLAETLSEPLTTVDAPRQSWPVRHRLHTSTDHLTDPSTIAAIRARLDTEQSVLVVANNVQAAQNLFAELGPCATELFGEGAATLLHSRFRRCDRQAIEARVRGRFGTRGPGQPGLPGLLVGTQAVEVSLDVDFDALHTSGAPLDALLQRFGRVNRRGDRDPADVVVHEPEYRARGRSREMFADAVYSEAPTRQTFGILAEHDGTELSEVDATEWLDQIYAGTWGEKWRGEVREQRDAFTDAFLTFRYPFHDRTHLEAAYDEFFNGSEAVLRSDLDEYRELLDSTRRSVGQLLADDLLIPLPAYSKARIRWDKGARVRYIDAGYDPETGLGAILGPDAQTYRPGEVI